MKKSLFIFSLLAVPLFFSACGSLPGTHARTSRALFGPPDSAPSSEKEAPVARTGRMDGVEYFINRDLASANTLEPASGLEEAPELQSIFESSQRSWRPQKGFNIPVVKNERVNRWIGAFTGPLRKNFSRWLHRASLYAPYMEEVLRKNNLPTDIIYLGMIESGFNLHAYSRAHAAGPWQFIRSTGKIYGLESGGIVDERRDLVKATTAAARHLKDLHNLYGDWYLAFAAYNAGAGGVNRAIRRSGTRNFWKMTAGRSRFLKQETKDYVPRILAAAIVTKDYKKYGFSPQIFDKPVDFEVITVPDATDISVIARCARVSREEIEQLNPSLMAGVTPPGRSYSVLVPGEAADRFRKNFARIPRHERTDMAFHRVKKKETLATIAHHYKISRNKLAQTNHLTAKSRLFAGSLLAIPGKGNSTPIDMYLEPEIQNSPTEGAIAALDTFQAAPPKEKRVVPKVLPAPVPTDAQLIVHRVRRGESLWDLAQKYRVSVEMIKRWNNLSGNNLYVSQRIKVYAKMPQATAKKVASVLPRKTPDGL